MWIHLGEGWSIDTNDALRRIAFEQRGGYCFHLNGAFHQLLTALGYDAVRHVGSVSGPDGPTPDELANHLALTVRNVPSADPTMHGHDWYVDLGLGDGLYEPMLLRAGEHHQAPMNFTLSELGDDRWRLNHDTELGAFTSMTFNTEPTEMSAFVSRHHELATSPDSQFVRTVTAQRRDASGVDAMRGLVLKRIGDVSRRTDLLTSDEWYTALSEVFGLPLTHVSVEDRTTLWRGVKAKHDAWAQRQD